MSDLLQKLNSEFKSLKRSDRHRESIKATADFITDLESLYSEIEAQDDNFSKSYLDKSATQKLNASHEKWEDTLKNGVKTKNNGISKFGKNILDKVDEFELDELYIYKIPKDEHNLQLIDNAIKLHLIRNGDLSVLNDGAEKDGVNDLSTRLDLNILAKFSEMNTILQNILNRDLKDAIAWTIQNEDILIGQLGSELEFKLHRLQFLQYYNDNEPIKALQYAQTWFPKFIKTNGLHEKNLSHVSKLMVSILFDSQDTSLPYHQNNQLLDTQFKEAAVLFSKEYCSVLGFAFESSIFTIVLAGIVSTPNFLKFVQIKNLNNSVNWASKDELPFEIDLPEFLKKYHPIFICPVSKEETTKENPPMTLPCHHIISKNSLDKLSRHGSSFKCPYCPTNCVASQCKQVTFYHI